MSCQRTTLGHGPLLETLFRSRAKATAASLHYKAISAHVRRQAPMFLEFLQKNGKKWRADLAKIPAHSGRATFRTHGKWPNR